MNKIILVGIILMSLSVVSAGLITDVSYDDDIVTMVFYLENEWDVTAYGLEYKFNYTEMEIISNRVQDDFIFADKESLEIVQKGESYFTIASALLYGETQNESGYLGEVVLRRLVNKSFEIVPDNVVIATTEEDVNVVESIVIRRRAVPIVEQIKEDEVIIDLPSERVFQINLVNVSGGNTSIQINEVIEEVKKIMIRLESSGSQEVIINVSEIGIPKKVFVDESEVSFSMNNDLLSFFANFSERLITLDYTSPAPSPPPSSGGGGRYTPSCDTEWRCSNWGECFSDGLQTRVCDYPMGECRPETERPKEIRECDYVAPEPTPVKSIEDSKEDEEKIVLENDRGKEITWYLVIVIIVAGIVALIVLRKKYTKDEQWIEDEVN